MQERALTYHELGHHGRLGNQLFQIAAAMSYAAEHDMACVMPPWPYAVYLADPRPDLFSNTGVETPDIVVREQGFAFDGTDEFVNATLRSPHAQMARTVSLHGYFQSERFFAKHADAVRSLFQPHPVMAEYLQSKYATLFQSGHRRCAIHVRRGDYTWNHQRHPLQPFLYYDAALKEMYKHGGVVPVFIVFSDDIPYCKAVLANQLHLPMERTVFVEGNVDIADMWLMSACHDHVIANSTFSWWGAWLCKHPDKRVVAPLSNWFGPQLAHLDKKDLLPAGWVGL